MKKILLLTGLLVIVLAIGTCYFQIGEMPDAWTVSGTTTFFGGPPGGSFLKLAAFYTDDDGSNNTTVLVSNVVEVTNNGTFSLDIDASGLKTYDYRDSEYDVKVIKLIMWDDGDNNDVYAAGETDYDLDTSKTCPVFQGAYDCQFVWYDRASGCALDTHDKGWNVDKGGLFTGDESVNKSVLQGAKIIYQF